MNLRVRRSRMRESEPKSVGGFSVSGRWKATTGHQGNQSLLHIRRPVKYSQLVLRLKDQVYQWSYLFNHLLDPDMQSPTRNRVDHRTRRLKVKLDLNYLAPFLIRPFPSFQSSLIYRCAMLSLSILLLLDFQSHRSTVESTIIATHQLTAMPIHV